MTAHFVGSGRFQAVAPSREHALHAPDVRSDIRFGPWRRCSHLCSHLPGSRGRSYSTCQRRHVHVRDLMSDRTSGAWSTCSLGGLTPWKRPEPTKWAVVVIFCARLRGSISLGHTHLQPRIWTTVLTSASRSCHDSRVFSIEAISVVTDGEDLRNPPSAGCWVPTPCLS